MRRETFLTVITVCMIFAGLGLFASCGGARPQSVSRILVHEDFDTPQSLTVSWMASLPEQGNAVVKLEGQALRLTSPSVDAVVRRTLDPSQVQGRRIRLTANIRTESNGVEALAVFRYSSMSGPIPKQVSTRRVASKTESRVDVVADIPDDVTYSEIALVLKTSGTAWFSNIVVESLGPSEPPHVAQLTRQQLTNIEAVTRLAMLVRYRHPSDQAASLDWDVFLPEVIDRVLHVADNKSLLVKLQEIFYPIAPTLELSASQSRSAKAPVYGQNLHLARWQHFGLGTGIYAQWREGRDPDLASLQLSAPLETYDLRGCKHIQLRASARTDTGAGEASIYVDVKQPGRTSKKFEEKITSANGDISIEVDTTSDAQGLSLGIALHGEISLDVYDATIYCENGSPRSVDFAKATWTPVGTTSMYASHTTQRDGHSSLRVSRNAYSNAISERDNLDIELSTGIWAHLPLAVWTDGARTYPVISSFELRSSHAVLDLPVRLAIISSAWGTIQTFFPYFPEARVDWRAVLQPALLQSAAASSFEGTRGALLSMLAKLHDNHIVVSHPEAPIDGMLPVSLQRFGQQLFVVGVLADYAGQIPLGSEVIAIDQVPVISTYNALIPITPAATSGWEKYIVPYWLTIGPKGTFSRLTLRTPAGALHELVLPRLSRDVYDAIIHEPRPVSGSSLEPGIIYVNLDRLDLTHWQNITASVSQARAIILDMRGYPTNAAYTLLGQFSDTPLLSPIFKIPHLETGAFETRQWEIRPVPPRIRVELFILMDGRADSAAETFLQIAHDNHVGTLIGEPSGGTNGVVGDFTLPGGFSTHITGMRTLFPDGSTIHGQGVQPDVMVHPTAEAMKSGRDEILEEAIRRARAAIRVP